MSAYWDATVIPSLREARFIQRPHGIFGRYRQPPQNWSDRETILPALKEWGLTWDKALALASAKSSSGPRS